MSYYCLVELEAGVNATEVFVVNKYVELLNMDPERDLPKVLDGIKGPLAALVTEENMHYIWNPEQRIWNSLESSMMWTVWKKKVADGDW